MRTFYNHDAQRVLISIWTSLAEEKLAIDKAFDLCDNPAEALLDRGIEVEEKLAGTKARLRRAETSGTKFFCIPVDILSKFRPSRWNHLPAEVKA